MTKNNVRNMVAEVLTMTAIMLRGIKLQKEMIDIPREIRRFTWHVSQKTCTDKYPRGIMIAPGIFHEDELDTSTQKIHNPESHSLSIEDLEPTPFDICEEPYIGGRALYLGGNHKFR